MPLLRPSDIAKLLRVTPRHVHRLADAQRLPGQRKTKGGQLRFIDCPALHRELKRLSAAKAASTERTQNRRLLSTLTAEITAKRIAYRRAFREMNRAERREVKDVIRDQRNPRKEIEYRYLDKIGFTPQQLIVVKRDIWPLLHPCAKWACTALRRIDQMEERELKMILRDSKPIQDFLEKISRKLAQSNGGQD